MDGPELDQDLFDVFGTESPVMRNMASRYEPWPTVMKLLFGTNCWDTLYGKGYSQVAVVSGIIGAGKTTLLKSVCSKLNVPLEQEMALKDPQLITNFYANKWRYGYTFQKAILESYINENKVKGIAERSAFCSIFVFCAALTIQYDLSCAQLERIMECFLN